MTAIDQMLNAHPKDLGINQALLAECITACLECSGVCTACADACLSEDMVAELTACISTNLNCADICATTARVLSRQTRAGTRHSACSWCSAARNRVPAPPRPGRQGDQGTRLSHSDVPNLSATKSSASASSVGVTTSGVEPNKRVNVSSIRRMMSARSSPV